MRNRARITLPTVAPTAVTQLSVKGVTKSYGTRTILDQVSFTVRPGDKAAVIGENGAGKSTLLRLLAAAERPDTGEITVSFPGGTGHLAQTLDRGFLERIATTILEVDRDERTVRRYGDGWAGYRAAKAAARRAAEQRYADWAEEVARMEELLEAAGRRLATTGRDPKQGFGKHRRSSEAKLGGQVRSVRERLAQLRRNPVATPPAPLRFTPALSAAEGPAREALAEFDGVRVGERLRLDGFLAIAPGQRLLVTGENGAGKTTLLRVLAGDLEPDAGSARRPDRIGYLPQELPAHSTRLPLLAAFAAGRPGPPDEYGEQLLALGLFREEDLYVPAAALSVGQRRRLQIARLVTRPADLLVLDEPTNHIALDLVEDLQTALAAYPGAVVAVSHDRGFRAGFAGERLELHEGRRR
ncbi:ATP-binding cassette domain-containing protein [Streptomyces paradoxus]|uniref:ATP-binding cassette domain-containing protein n=1 Tax=Streptomyces paradoxus TaxID=66375 RepID=UPI00380CD1EE